MGHLYYGYSTDSIEVPDEELAYLKMVTTTKLRRNESFNVSWQHPDDESGARSTIWLHAAIPLRFVFDTSEAPQLDREHLRVLAEQAASSRGITLDLAGTAVSDADAGSGPRPIRAA